MANISQLRSQMRQENVSKAGIDAMAADITTLTGEIRVNGAGESRAQITFPLKFSQKPSLSFGGEIIEGDAILDGFMPTVNVVVLGWRTEERPPTSRLYIGADLGVVLGGVNHQKAIIHWTLVGKAITSPS